MDSIQVKDLMVPLEDYATVSEDATLSEAVLVLEEAQKNFDQNRYQHRAILVYEKTGKIVGKVSQFDILKALEPKLEGTDKLKKLDRFGMNTAYLRDMIHQYGLFKKPLQDICEKAASLKVKNVMYTPSQGEIVSEESALNEAILQLLAGHHQSLLVTRGSEIVGILRLTDVFKEVTDMIKACKI